MTDTHSPELPEAVERVSRYLAEKATRRGIDKEHIHGFDGDVDLFTADVAALVECALAALSARSQSEWQPIETAPKDEPFLILSVPGRSFIGCWFEIPYREIRDADGVYIDHQDYEAYWMDNTDGEAVEPTRWHPRPAPPKAGAETGGEG